MQEHTLQVDGVPIRWEERSPSGPGDGPVVVFVHGIPTCPALWRHVIPLVPEARCLAFEMVGYGHSALHGKGRDVSVARQARYLVSWLEALGVERAVLVGHDLGGGVVQIAATRRPARCSGLVLTNAIAFDSWPIPSVRAMQAVSGLVARMPIGMFRLLLRTFIARGHDDASRAREAYETHRVGYERADGAKAFVRQIEALRTEDTVEVAPLLRQLRVPARVVWGAADPFQKVAYGERLAEALGTTLTRIEGGKHFTPEDHPEPIALAIDAVLAEILQADRTAPVSSRRAAVPPPAPRSTR